MEESVDVREILRGDFEGKSVSVYGWVHETVEKNGRIFCMIRDGSGFIQAVVEKNADSEAYKLASQLNKESVVRIFGEVFQEENIPGKYGIKIKRMVVLSSSSRYPEDISRPEYRYLRMREPKQRATIIIANTAINAMRDYLRSKGFVEVWPPTITQMAAEDPGTLFTFQYFQDIAHLSQTAQPYLESLIPSLKKVFSITPTYRRERIQNKRHLSEFYSFEVEEGFSNLDDIMRLNEDMFSIGVRSVIEKNPDELKTLNRDVEQLKLSTPFKRMTYDEVVKKSKEMKKDGKELAIKRGESLSHDLVEELCKEYKAPFFVTHFPVSMRAWHTREDPKRHDVTLSYDLFAPIAGEIATGGERIIDPETLLKRIDNYGLPFHSYKWYVELREYGPVSSAGFGMGIERVLQFITGLDDIKDVALYPRAPYMKPYP
jgi:asparaginyl-tRNA synthetase